MRVSIVWVSIYRAGVYCAGAYRAGAYRAYAYRAYACDSVYVCLTAGVYCVCLLFGPNITLNLPYLPCIRRNPIWRLLLGISIDRGVIIFSVYTNFHGVGWCTDGLASFMLELNDCIVKLTSRD